MFLSLVDGTVLEESSQVAQETLLEEADAHRVKKEHALKLLERVLLEVLNNETHVVIRDTYRYLQHCNYGTLILR